MTYSWTNENGEPIMDGAAYRFEQQLDADYAAEYYGSPEYLDSLDDEPDECNPGNDFCLYDDDDCVNCASWWLDFHADGMEDQWLDGSYEE